MNQKKQSLTYNIQQVSNITGLSKQVIRKWEERYQIVQPKRLDNGYRIYSHEEVNTLLFVKSLVDKGHSVKQAALLVQQQERLDQLDTKNEWKPKQEDSTLNEYVLQLLQEGTFCHETNMNRLLQKAYHAYGLKPFIKNVVIPFLKEVGDRWEKGHWGEYQEALASLVVRDFVVQLRRNFKHDENAPLILGACIPNERHEIPLQIILLYGILQGWKPVMLGPSPAPNAIQSTIQKLNPKIVVLSAVTTIPFEQDPNLLKNLDDFATNHPNIKFYLGGPGALKYTKNKKLQSIQVTEHIDEILKQDVGETY